MNVLILNQDWFAAELREMGHHVVTAGLATHLQCVVEAPLIHIDTIIKAAMPGHEPDVILVLDNSAPIMFQGLDETLVPTVFYSVDTHHHAAVHKYLANVFDYTLIAQKDYIPAFNLVGHQPEWMPLWASRHIEPSLEKKFQAVFVGTMNAKLNPGRVAFFEALKKKVPVHVQGGNFWEIFPHAEVVVNQTVKGDLNFRVFEAMMSGATLLTEKSANGLLELFEDNKHLVTYTKDNVDEAAEKIHGLLAEREHCRAIGLCGREEILAKHTAWSRSVRIEQILGSVKKKKSSAKYFSMMLNFASLATRLEVLDTSTASRAFLAALKSAQYALNENEILNDELACFVILACLNYERLIRTGAAETFLFEVAQRNPQMEVLSLACIRELLNKGNLAQAEKLARTISNDDVTGTFQRSETFVTELLTVSTA